MTLKLGIPSKGRLQAATIDWFATLGVTLAPVGGREYAGAVEGISDVSLVMLSAGEIPRELMAGRIHMGLTGRDLIEEKCPGWQDVLTAEAEPGFGYADLIIAVPAFWDDCDTLDDLDAIAAAFRAKHGFRLRIATKYHNLVRRHLMAAGIADYQLVDSQGATEGTIRNLTAEVIADITSTGETLRANHLKILGSAPILKSEAVLWSTARATRDAAADAAFQALRARIAAA